MSSVGARGAATGAVRWGSSRVLLHLTWVAVQGSLHSLSRPSHAKAHLIRHDHEVAVAQALHVAVHLAVLQQCKVQSRQRHSFAVRRSGSQAQKAARHLRASAPNLQAYGRRQAHLQAQDLLDVLDLGVARDLRRAGVPHVQQLAPASEGWEAGRQRDWRPVS